MDEDRIARTANDVTGKPERSVLVGHADTTAAGSVRQAAGKAEEFNGQAKDAAGDATDAAARYAKWIYRQSKAAIAHKRLRSSWKTIRFDRS